MEVGCRVGAFWVLLGINIAVRPRQRPWALLLHHSHLSQFSQSPQYQLFLLPKVYQLTGGVAFVTFNPSEMQLKVMNTMWEPGEREKCQSCSGALMGFLGKKGKKSSLNNSFEASLCNVSTQAHLLREVCHSLFYCPCSPGSTAQV